MRNRIVISVVVGGVATALLAQSPAFEVVAIRQHTEGPFYTMLGPGLKNGHLTALMVTPRRMLQTAYGMTPPRVIGPDWLDRDRFDIAGESPKGVPDSDLKPMLQAFLKDRFKLAVHMETREMPVYFLVIAKGGPKLHKYPEPDGALEHPNDDPNVKAAGNMMRGTSTTAAFADMLTMGAVARPVIDRTGLTDRYNYFLSYSPSLPQTGGEIPPFSPMDIFEALQKQLGLKLESGRDKVQVVVVDHMEQMPTEN